ncbi:MAG: tetratricopeptide repeat protein [Candidatus Promineifilaceae bacterium]
MWRSLIKVLGSGILLLLILIVGMNFLMPQSTANIDAVQTANQLYDNDNLVEAIEIYEQLKAQGVHDSVVFYNLGNAYYRSGDLGRALTNYSRAAQLEPRDPDIKANLNLARSQISEPFIEDDPGFAGVLSRITDGWLSVNEAAMIALSLWFMAGLLFIGMRYTQDRDTRAGLQYAALLVILLLLLTGLSLSSRLYVEQTHPEGVVVVPTIAVSSEPNDGFTTDIQLSSGAEVRFVETIGNWGRLAIPGDSIQSWIPLETVEMVAALSPGLSLLG